MLTVCRDPPLKKLFYLCRMLNEVPGTALDIVGDVKAAEKEQKKRQKGLKKAQITTFVSSQQRSPHAGYVVFRDKRIVLFYTNDLVTTPSANVLDGTTREAQICCNGMGFLQRWTGTEVFRHSNVCAPAIVCAYNKYMNAVDRFDQLRSTNPTRRRGLRLQMSIFTWLLDVAIHNAFSMYQIASNASQDNIGIDESVEVSTLKLCVKQRRKLSTDWWQHNTSMCRVSSTELTIEDVVGSGKSQYMLTRSRNKLLCLLCSIQGGKTYVKYAYEGSFMAVHYKHMMSENAAVLEALDAVILTASGMPKTKTRHRQNNSIIEPCDIKLPDLVIKAPA
ncbi:LOW QUALITY PROTEIN: hypothetical protein PHMEG_00013340 [Phytophthora megakarya]|uniref:PiggyBac transposable element-derived protein domain-containing protein n=1 Tax=Phytophthora megakarya TaxID=4795 RepID=A0A225W6Y8_9STRA|nr:LOW QUALITY PROTEIN: hypothetical protein PHMEG_00013340 [Phytophthora megakarya]